MSRDLISVLRSEKVNKISGGAYDRLQVDLAYNSNKIEGGGLSRE